MGDNIMMNIDVTMHVVETESSNGSFSHPLAQTHHVQHTQLCLKENIPTATGHRPGILDTLRTLPNANQCQKIREIEQIWDEIGLPDAEVEKRLGRFLEAFGSAFTSVVDAGLDKQREFRDQLNNRIRTYQEKIQENELILEMQSVDCDDPNQKIFDREISLRNRCNVLMKIRVDREKILSDLIEQNRTFAEALQVPVFNLPEPELQFRTGFLEDFKGENTRLKAVFDHHRAQAEGLWQQIDELCAELRVDHVDLNRGVFSDDILNALQDKLEELTSVKLSNIEHGKATLKRIRYLCERLELVSGLIDEAEQLEESLYDPVTINRLEQEKERLELEARQNMRSLIVKLRDSILSMYAKTYTSKEEKDEFTAMESEDFTEELLQAHEAELGRLENVYERNRLVFTLLDEHARLMERKTELEEQEADPEVLKNRGGILLKVQNEKKKVVKDIATAAADLQDAVTKASVDGQPFLIFGMPFDKFLAHRQKMFDSFKPVGKNTRGHAAKDPPSTVKRKAAKETPADKRMKPEGSTNGTFVKGAALSSSSQDVSTTTKVMGPIARRINFTDRDSPAPNATLTSVVSIKVKRTPQSRAGK